MGWSKNYSCFAFISHGRHLAANHTHFIHVPTRSAYKSFVCVRMPTVAYFVSCS